MQNNSSHAYLEAASTIPSTISTGSTKGKDFGTFTNNVSITCAFVFMFLCIKLMEILIRNQMSI